ncbi:glutathione S-transferase family protein [Roseibacterium sp. SDUM158017]|uniref:glutathione S-transferase family protein n=1 Tax=Roseicyclus salinarum TaxID=3036773 RepID=UPI00241589C3|nr:glutathione S-transferase family protein [Roseibacterium sp. SDUM158017]MDG4646815.1 glutathione S-transferase family protein [Roseibacterium sp. SDUM158017]
MTAYQVIGSVKSRTMRVLWMLEEIGASYEHVPAAPRSDEVTRFNPAGKVPVLVADGVPISDSVAIMTFLGDRHGKLTHTPGTIERARQDSLTQAIIDEFDAPLWMAARHSFILPEDMRMPGIKDSLRWEFERSQEQFLPRMAEDGPFLMGEELTIPDILLAHCMGWAVGAKFPVTEPFREHARRMRERPAFERASAA